MLALIEQRLRDDEHRLRDADRRYQGPRARRWSGSRRGEVPLFLISLKAGGVGLNLTAADTVIHYDPWWNPAVEDQATDRAHRIGQTKKVFVHRLVTLGTIEEKMEVLKDKKRAIVAERAGRGAWRGAEADRGGYRGAVRARRSNQPRRHGPFPRRDELGRGKGRTPPLARPPAGSHGLPETAQRSRPCPSAPKPSAKCWIKPA